MRKLVIGLLLSLVVLSGSVAAAGTVQLWDNPVSEDSVEMDVALSSEYSENHTVSLESNRDWIEPQQESFTLQPGESERVTIAINQSQAVESNGTITTTWSNGGNVALSDEKTIEVEDPVAGGSGSDDFLYGFSLLEVVAGFGILTTGIGTILIYSKRQEVEFH